jgi:phosphoglycerol transferase
VGTDIRFTITVDELAVNKALKTGLKWENILHFSQKTSFATGSLVVGDHSLPENSSFQLPMNGFTLARVAGKDNTVDFKKSAWPGVLSSAYGLAVPEVWGTWSLSDVVTLEFSKPLPEKFAVHLVASAFGPNVGKEFVAHVGDSGARFTLSASPEERVLEFSNPKVSKIIKIDVPSPCSPKELGLSADGRSLGIALRELRIEPL